KTPTIGADAGAKVPDRRRHDDRHVAPSAGQEGPRAPHGRGWSAYGVAASQRAVATTEEQQRVADAMLERLDLTHEEGVIAGFHGAPAPADQLGDRAFDDREAVEQDERVVSLRHRASGELVGQPLLIQPQDADAEP